MDFDIFLVAPPGLETILADEAREKGLTVKGLNPGGVTLTGAWPEVWRANIELSGATRVLARIAEFRAFFIQIDTLYFLLALIGSCVVATIISILGQQEG